MHHLGYQVAYEGQDNLLLQLGCRKALNCQTSYFNLSNHVALAEEGVGV